MIDVDLITNPAYGSAWFADLAGFWCDCKNEYAIDRQNGVGFRIARSER